MNNLKFILSAIAALAIAVVVITISSCHQNNVIPKLEVYKKFQLSNRIINLDNKVKNNKQTRMSEDGWRKLVGYVVADGASAWAAYKLVGKYLGGGYGGAASLLAGIGGSVYEAWQAGDISFGIVYNPTNPNPDPAGSSLSENYGILHNLIVQEITMGSNSIDMSNESSFLQTTYDYVIARVAEELNLDEAQLRLHVSFIEYSRLIFSGQARSAQDVYDACMVDSTDPHIMDYMNEYYVRIMSNNVTLDQLRTYTYLFIDDIDSQSAFSEQEKSNIKSTLYIHLYSSYYWEKI